MGRCGCTTLKGEQCHKTAAQGSKFCTQHQKCKRKAQRLQTPASIAQVRNYQALMAQRLVQNGPMVQEVEIEPLEFSMYMWGVTPQQQGGGRALEIRKKGAKY